MVTTSHQPYQRDQSTVQITQLAELLGRSLFCLSRTRQRRVLQTTPAAPACLMAATGEPCCCPTIFVSAVMPAPAASSSVSTGWAKGLPHWVLTPNSLPDWFHTAAVCCSAQFLHRAGCSPEGADSLTAHVQTADAGIAAAGSWLDTVPLCAPIAPSGLCTPDCPQH